MQFIQLGLLSSEDFYLQEANSDFIFKRGINKESINKSIKTAIVKKAKPEYPYHFYTDDSESEERKRPEYPYHFYTDDSEESDSFSEFEI